MSVLVNKESAVRTAMHGRILRCPIGGNPSDCPLYEIRQLSIEERMEWLDSKSDFELTALFGYHVKCLERKKAESSTV